MPRLRPFSDELRRAGTHFRRTGVSAAPSEHLKDHFDAAGLLRLPLAVVVVDEVAPVAFSELVAEGQSDGSAQEPVARVPQELPDRVGRVALLDRVNEPFLIIVVEVIEVDTCPPAEFGGFRVRATPAVVADPFERAIVDRVLITGQVVVVVLRVHPVVVADEHEVGFHLLCIESRD
ncbi:hypothetical protein [Rathayibacter rathayi]|uniref:hypothetical protein n=1 Tax=Rathayibacter rathayi TaxID=33887 RepID=UPI000CE8FE70|nr:hypothetical protein [Rathayibacter rathayi]PPG09829.1 hypothetical protein C5C11_14960 [Rathayibacter rathayi]